MSQILDALENEAAPEPSVASPARRQLLTMAAALGGAAFAGAIFGAKPARADFIENVGKVLYLDPIVLNFAFEMEELEADFFNRAVRSSAFGAASESQRNVLSLIAIQDQKHFDDINQLRGRLGYKPGGHFESLNQSSSRRPKFFRYPSISTPQKLMETSIDLKETVLFAYHGAVGLVKDPALLKLAAAIAGVEGRHAAVLRLLADMDPVPAPFEGALTAQKAGSIMAKKYGFRGGANVR